MPAPDGIATDGAPTLTRRTVLGAAGAVGAAGLLAATTSAEARAQGGGFLVGRGVGDMTGEPLGAGMNGYAETSQISTGLHLRQRARAFVIASAGDPAARVALVTCEIGLMFQSIQQEVLRRLAARFGGRYHEGNVLLTATHTHSAPGGTSGHPMVDLSAGGFRPATFESNVQGIVDAVVRADAELVPAALAVTAGALTDAGRNRSITSFQRDPQAEQDHFPGAVDPRSQTLQISRRGELVGVLNWFAVHATSMSKHTRACSTDNKGYAAWLWERGLAGVDHLAPGTPRLVAAFAQSAPGDISPNLDLHPGQGPTGNEYANCTIIGERQFRAAADQVGRPARSLAGRVRTVHTWVDMAGVVVGPEFTGDGRSHTTAPAALGAAFAAGSQEDGGGGDDLPLNEGARGGNPVIAAVDGVVVPAWLREAHAPKDVLIPSGLIPNFIQRVYPFHLVAIGDSDSAHYLFGLGFEPTIVTGLRIRRTLAAELGVPEDHVTVQGYTNAYGHYLTTPEEYTAQNYEGGATAFGPWSVPAVQQIAAGLARALRDGHDVDPGAPLRDLTGQIPVSPLAPPLPDTTRPGQRFGDVLVQPAPSCRRHDTVRAVFVGTNPNADLRRDDTYLAVERVEAGGWVRVHDDADWSTIIWFDALATIVDARIEWTVPETTPPGEYRIVYTASGRAFDGSLFPVRGESAAFRVE